MIKAVNMKKEIVVTVANSVGALANICKILADHGINLEAFVGYGMGKEAKIHLVTVDNLRASDALKKAGYKSQEEKSIVVIDLENKVGALKLVTEKVAQEKVDIKYAYGTTCSSGCPATIALSASDNEKAFVALKKG
ncbi:MAG: ACT domain-containing protein [Candidatus Omnitrophota bacterium]|nr:ACT domain-containing protein [Candidatus Omnitrophota bacterium]